MATSQNSCVHARFTQSLFYRCGLFFFGFIRESRDEVDAMYVRLQEAGFASEAPRAVHGSWSFYFKAPGDILVEVQSVIPR